MGLWVWRTTSFGTLASSLSTPCTLMNTQGANQTLLSKSTAAVASAKPVCPLFLSLFAPSSYACCSLPVAQQHPRTYISV